MLQTVRIVFSKTGRAKYISHLDLVRTMTRVVRRAGIPLWYTEGFNRHPYLTFAAPLSLGFEGLRETMDLRLEEDMKDEELVRRLNEALPEGLAAVSAAPAVAKAGELAAAEYMLTFDCSIEPIAALLSQAEILVEKKTKKKTMKTIDIRPAFADAVLESVGERTQMRVILPCGNDTVNPSLFLTALNAATQGAYTCAVRRLELYLADGRPFR
ncbi:MAG: DUF2344 domain-containing protein [Clostridia bacterium]|nr:DUF2344 domain-containing protein [Clostridia bacterium]